MKIIPYTLFIAILFVSCQNPKEKALVDLQAFLEAIEAEKDTYQATQTSINETNKAMINKYMEGVRSGNINSTMAEIMPLYKRVSVNYDEALKNYLNLIPQVNEIIGRANEDHIVAASLESSLNQLEGQRGHIKNQLDELKAEHEKLRQQFENVE